ncbi:hypothetical protein [Streptomyces sp. SLBN-31]|uniref:hypothetical protein n=1 Tax=Streptomyces sp. SLBN-31 TaxID=2768444 RepID=UPI001169FDF5|nr:hypothetical protein [Streptomyces sp. SLBN-31]TQJ91250.1 hypothetical protein FBY22_2059 [Streptomyces sp. SLBN-31]
MIKKHPGWAVMAAWGLFNAILAAILVIYREDLIAIMLYVGAVVLIEVAALAVLISSRRGQREPVTHRLPVRGAVAVPPAAAGLTLAGLSLAYGPWMLSLAIPLLMVAAALAVHRGAWSRESS